MWLARGAKLSWSKGQIGQSVVWIGAEIKRWQAPPEILGVRVGISEPRIQKLQQTCTQGILMDEVGGFLSTKLGHRRHSHE